MHTPQSLADVLERDYFPMPDGAKLFLAEHEWRMVIAALRASPPEAPGEDVEMLLEVARSGVSYERPGRYVEVQIAGGLWAQLQEWRKRRYDIPQP